MVRKKGSLILCGGFLFVAWNALLLLYLWGRPLSGRLGEGGGAEPGGKEEWGVGRGRGGNLAGEVIRLAEEVEVQLETQKKLLKQIEGHRAVWARQRDVGKRDTAAEKKDANEEAVQREQKAPPLPIVKDSEDVREQTDVKQTQKPAATEAVGSKPEQQHATEVKQESQSVKSSTPTPDVIIPILVIACDRVTVKRSLDKLIQYRPSPQLYPIIVSQDCGHAETARVIGSYGDQLTLISQPDLSDIRVRPEHRKFQGYYKIARHYRWALNQVFNVFLHSTVVIVEDDLEESGDGKCQLLDMRATLLQAFPGLTHITIYWCLGPGGLDQTSWGGCVFQRVQLGGNLDRWGMGLEHDLMMAIRRPEQYMAKVAPDFFEYFRALYPILRSDPSLWCVSAWNDNGRDALVDSSKAGLLHRTDFFPGLGWMLLKEMWDELEPKWPSAFWDDWMRQPEQRKERSCIRPEISRTITFGRKGVSLGQFFDQYLRYIKLNTEFVPFTKMDLSYLLKDKYEVKFILEVYSAHLVKIEDLQQGAALKGPGPFRVQYSSRDSFKVFARNLGVMDDLKSGVPRTGYRGVVSFLHRGRRVFLAPPEGWTQYDVSWS